jgi:hypothetical protein
VAGQKKSQMWGKAEGLNSVLQKLTFDPLSVKMNP